MLQQVMTKPGEIIFQEVPVPEIGDNQVLVKIMKIGICGSDIHVYHGKHPFTKYPPETVTMLPKRYPARS
jgi:L-iditol 2-dehydrogenase